METGAMAGRAPQPETRKASGLDEAVITLSRAIADSREHRDRLDQALHRLGNRRGAKGQSPSQSPVNVKLIDKPINLEQKLNASGRALMEINSQVNALLEELEALI